MSAKISSPGQPSRSKGRAAGRARRLTTRLVLLLCAPLALTFVSNSDARRSQTDAQPQTAPTPYVRPRTVTPKSEPERQTAQPETAQPQSTPQPRPTAQPQPTPQAIPQQPAPQTQPARPAEGNSQPAPAAPAQNSAAPAQDSVEVDEEEVVRVDSNLVIIPASVVDGRGRAITDLKVEDFELRVDGEVKAIGDLSRAETPVHVTLLFDNSASLSAAREFEKQAAVRFFRSVVRPIDRAAIYSISTVPTLAQGLTNDVPRLVRTIERFGKPEGATALFDAVAQAAEYMRPLVGRKVLVLVSDGTDTVSDTTFDDAVNRALRAECQIYVVQTRQVEDPNLHDPVSEQRMYRISEQTGGAVYVPQSVEELDAVFTQISLDLSQQYLLSYYPQDDRTDKYFRFISLRVKTRPALRVRARKGFYPPSAAQTGGAAGADRAQFSGTLTAQAVPEYVTASQVPQRNDGASFFGRSAAAAPPAAAATNRDAAAPKRARPGPQGPDDFEEAKPSAAKGEPAPTFTLTTSAAAPASKPAATPERLFPVAPVVTEPALPAPTPSAPAATTLSANAPGAEAAAASAAPQPFAGERPKAPVSGGVLNGKALTLPKPIYPDAARNSGASGKVVVEVTIDEEGKIVEARALSGHPYLWRAAVEAARRARFSPAKLSGEPVKVRGVINYVFMLP